MRRLGSSLFVLGLGAAGLAGGCSHSGDFEVAWQFAADPQPIEAVEGCGLHGVDSVLVTGASDSGDGTNVIGLCTAGSVRGSVPVGNWSFSIHTLDGHGKTIFPLDMPDGTTDTLAVPEGGLQAFPPVVLTPRPACADGIDNDRDGRVDLDDPDCGGDPTWTDESTPKAP